MINNSESFKSAVKILTSRSKGFKRVMTEVVSYAHAQATENRNSSPFMVIRENLPGWVKPTGCTMKALDQFVLDYAGFEWNKETKSYKSVPGVNLRELPDQGCAFWDHAKDDTIEKQKWEALLAAARYMERGEKEGYTDDQLFDAMATAAAARQTKNKNNGLAETLGIAA